MLRFILLSALVALGSCQQHCPEGWQKYERSCYKYIDTELSWDAAAQYCVDNSLYNYGHLATIHTELENVFVTDIVLGGVKKRTWIGLNDKIDEGVFTWHAYNREPFWEKPSFWKNGEPNNGVTGKGDPREEDCVEINRGGLGRWNDCKCTKPLPFICEVEIYTLEKGGLKGPGLKNEARFD